MNRKQKIARATGAVTATFALSFGLAACGSNSGSEPSPSASESQSGVVDGMQTVSIAAPQSEKGTIGLNLVVGGDQVVSKQPAGITISGGKVSVGVGGPASLDGNYVLLTYSGNVGTRVVNSASPTTMKAIDGNAAASLTFSDITETQELKVYTVRPENLPDFASSNVLPPSTKVSGFSQTFTITKQ